MTYHEIIKVAVNAMLSRLNAYLPGNITELTYDCGLDKEVSLRSRMEMALYIELIKAGVINNSNYQNK